MRMQKMLVFISALSFLSLIPACGGSGDPPTAKYVPRSGDENTRINAEAELAKENANKAKEKSDEEERKKIYDLRHKKSDDARLVGEWTGGYWNNNTWTLEFAANNLLKTKCANILDKNGSKNEGNYTVYVDGLLNLHDPVKSGFFTRASVSGDWKYTIRGDELFLEPDGWYSERDDGKGGKIKNPDFPLKFKRSK